jgi:N-acylneuraminate cytidylyltransferase
MRLAVIPARGGSKRIPKKNIKKFFGKPMIAYAIEACLQSGIFMEVMVSTDCQEIARVAKQNGANVPFMRSKKNSDDFAPTYDVLVEVLLEYRKLGHNFDQVCCVYPCVPFLKSQTLKAAYEKMITMNVDALMPVCKYPVPIEWAMQIQDGLLIPNDREAQKIRSQDLVSKYFDVGMFYYFKTDVVLAGGMSVPAKTFGYIISELECQDVDTEDDWKIAELKYRILHEANRA